MERIGFATGFAQLFSGKEAGGGSFSPQVLDFLALLLSLLFPQGEVSREGESATEDLLQELSVNRKGIPGEKKTTGTEGPHEATGGLPGFIPPDPSASLSPEAATSPSESPPPGSPLLGNTLPSPESPRVSREAPPVIREPGNPPIVQGEAPRTQEKFPPLSDPGTGSGKPANPERRDGSSAPPVGTSSLPETTEEELLAFTSRPPRRFDAPPSGKKKVGLYKAESAPTKGKPGAESLRFFTPGEGRGFSKQGAFLPEGTRGRDPEPSLPSGSASREGREPSFLKLTSPPGHAHSAPETPRIVPPQRGFSLPGSSHIPPVEVPRMIKDMVLEVHPSGEKKARLRLEPPDLGEVEVDLRVRHREVTLFLRVEKPEAAHQLQMHLAHLEKALDELGLRLTDFQIALAGSESGWRFREDTPHEEKPQKKGVERIEDGDREEALKIAPREGWHNGRLNLVV
ncbi:flagellar hook-length control protein FliK [Thermosulfurimonas sp. F29]|uniref:flagellar hook-length control protein FliK n=1 Tax=Thermosulfurimonas sp. F29 TaxID=2867247 RepID=UPI001C82FC16|nr:flagellar hook-length control protein FliK [Thermosulfurimonas sp. F29]MBX6423551.1 flagellar hook-length control protein FliK [Thermosulfurimonas sp. F29]